MKRIAKYFVLAILVASAYLVQYTLSLIDISVSVEMVLLCVVITGIIGLVRLILETKKEIVYRINTRWEKRNC